MKTINVNSNNYDYTYDANGNMISGYDLTDPANVGTRTVTYNTDNMPVHIVYTKGGSTTVDITYDAEGKREKKIVQGGSTTRYIGQYFEVKDGAPVKYVFGGNLRIAKVTAAALHYYHKDHLSSSTAMSDGTGTKIEGTEYLPFGGQRDHTGTSVSNYKFTDQELDTETGLYNYDARLYDPGIGRFISADSIMPNVYDPQSLNRYSYCRNNPLIYVDPSGHIAEPADSVSEADRAARGE